jgi:uncharacterized membrane protein
LITPLDDAHAELLARTSPNFYDVLIALFGGMAGAVAMTFRNKGNVLTGVAIATALMPPLCTVGYGIATGQPKFMLGALYLYLINSVFIALATYFYARLIKFPKVQLPDKKVESRSNRVILALTMLTLVPSVYLAYRMVIEQRFIQNAGRYIQTEFTDEGIFILRREIDPSARKISLYLGGNLIDSALEARLKSTLPKYKIAAASLILRQGIFRQENQLPSKNDALKDDRFYELLEVKRKYDSMVTLRALKRSLSDEASVLFPEVTGLYFHEPGDSMPSQVLVRSSSRTGNGQLDSAALRKWLTMRLGKSDVSLDVVR